MKNKTIKEIKAVAAGLQELADVQLSNELGLYAHLLRNIAKRMDEKKVKTWNQSVAYLNKVMK